MTKTTVADHVAAALVKWMGERLGNGTATTLAEVDRMGSEVFDMSLSSNDIRELALVAIAASASPDLVQAAADLISEQIDGSESREFAEALAGQVIGLARMQAK